MSRARAAAALLAGLLCLGPLATPSPAAAAACTDGRGVSVVVDFGALGGGVRQECDADGGGRSAADAFAGAGVELTYAQRAAGFVCRVEGVPTSDPCVNAAPADAYWGLWWSDGRSGEWTYSSLGAASLTVPAGGSVAFSWNSGSRRAPGAKPPVASAAAPSASSSPRPTPATGGRPGGGAGGAGGGASAASTAPAGTPSAAATPSATAQPGRGAGRAPRTGAASDRASGATSPRGPRQTASTDGAEQTDQADQSGETEAPGAQEPAVADTAGLPGWVVLAVIVLVFAGAAVVAVRRRGTARR